MTELSPHPVAADEADRIFALKSYRVLDTPPEEGLDTIVRLARRSFGVPIALVSFVAEDRQFFKARIGLDVCGSAREGSFCTHTILGRDVMVVPDATLDERFRQSSLVTEEPRIRFYAGAPLVTGNGFVIGALCIKDVVPRPHGLSADERLSLLDLAALVMDKLEIRRLSAAEADGRRRFDAVAGSSADAIVCANGANRILSWNGTAERMFGYTAEEAVGQLLNIIIPEQFWPRHEEGLRRAVAGLPTKLVGTLVTVPALRRDGTEFPIELSLSHWMEGGEHRFGAIARDITGRLDYEARLKYAAEYDALTDLANRTLLTSRLVAVAEGARAASLIFLDLDGFKDVNDSLGHAAGDEVLKAIAGRLHDAVPEGGLACRLGGDEFVIVVDGSADPMVASALADRLISEIERPLELGERSVYVGASAGVAVSPAETWTASSLLEEADLALYRAKSDGKGRARLYTQELRPTAQTRTSVSSGIRQAWERGEFELHYQPQVRLADGFVAGAEALIRWNHPERGTLAPAAFLSTLENSLLAVPVSEWILRTACEQAASWRASGLPGFRIGVNLFAAQFRAGDLAAVVERVLGETGLPGSGLELEITENTILRNESRIDATLRELRELGVGIAFDDYGTGYASLTMLKDFPVTRLKIDRSFVSGPGCGDGDRMIVEAISRLAHGFGLEVIAEGIETAEQARNMRSYCLEGQGYLFGRPMTTSDFTCKYASEVNRVPRRVA
ncbi:EAL domain-containing protein [Aureimonas sp. Leaf454]|uniref:putative bifunctional diguanylate cyclase/phosphodiesterase n=1 Tax=Aureimonas sp. Leaf454 TaxID=1736381 RepID=UPI000A590A97|nr:EAL domain-containing protein [Aureimonas sp. Leaf454]